MSISANKKAMLRTVLLLAWPTVVELALQTLVQYVDTAMVGHIGASASAAVGLTTTTMWLISAPFSAMGTGVLSTIAKAVGAKDTERVRSAAGQAVLLCLIVGISITAVALGAAPFLPGWLGADAQIRSEAFLYFFVINIPLLLRGLTIILGAALRAAGDTKTPLLVNATVNLVNIVFNYLLIGSPVTVLGLYIPRAGLGVLGAAIATALSFAVGGVLMLHALYRHQLLSPRGKPQLDKPVMRDCVSVGLPVMATRLFVFSGQVVFTSLVSRLGTLALAAHSIALTAEQAFYVPGFGIQTAASALSGQSIGAQNEKALDHVTVLTTTIASAAMGLMAVFLFFWPEAVMRIFTQDPAVIAMGAVILRIVAVSEPLYAVAIILEGVFNGAGDTKIPFLFSTGCMWGIRILFTYICTVHFGLGLAAVWGCMVADNCVRCLLLLIRVLRGRWKRRYFGEE